MRAIMILIAAAGVLSLSGCCVFGTSQQAYDVWTSPTLSGSRVAAIRRQCDADARQAADERFNAHLALLKQECAIEQPFASFVFLNHVTGKAIEGEPRERVLYSFRNACRIVAENPQPTPDDLDNTCVGCKPRLPAEACYDRQGLVRETRYRTVCAPMKMF
ncbi:hypothetical protein [Phytopseudomonas dryadis]|uniref:Lipoprotein n=1 Tax=Phytopseudomonas dryadis TaxID=2487520 RepID=A0A4Q9RA29_9GAMM|nr:hypothetical protein [Pseudomonas dryadis]TBU97563.1 hypothetical protein DNK44_00840 [Pseudomonas dryadis]